MKTVRFETVKTSDGSWRALLWAGARVVAAAASGPKTRDHITFFESRSAYYARELVSLRDHAGIPVPREICVTRIHGHRWVPWHGSRASSNTRINTFL